MAKPKMGWNPRQSRWRKTYKGVPLQILATDLGGTNRDDTIIVLQVKKVIGTISGSPGFKGKTARTFLLFFAEAQ